MPRERCNSGSNSVSEAAPHADLRLPLESLQTRGYNPVLSLLMPQKVLCVSWDRNLSRTREMLLTSAGFEVSSASGPAEARAACANSGADLLILGYSVPQSDKREMIRAFRTTSKSPVLSMLTPPQRPLPEAD